MVNTQQMQMTIKNLNMALSADTKQQQEVKIQDHCAALAEPWWSYGM